MTPNRHARWRKVRVPVRQAMDASLAKKLLLKPGTAFAVVAAPEEHGALLDGAGAVKGAGLVLVYAVNRDDVPARLPKVLKALDPDSRLWIAYPKAKKLGTDLNRDTLVGVLREYRFEPVRMVSIDETWSAMWFKRP